MTDTRCDVCLALDTTLTACGYHWHYLCKTCADLIKRTPEERKAEHPFICDTYGSGFAEYINGCPHCWETGIRSGVVERLAKETEKPQ